MLPRLDVLSKEAALSVRSLSRERAFTALCIILLALGIGFTSAVFTLLWQAVYAQLPIPDPTHIFAFHSNVTHVGRSQSDAMAETVSLPTYRYLASHLKVGSIVARHGELLNMETPGGPQHLLADFVSDNFFDILGIKAIIGRTISARTGDRFTAVLSYDFWQEAYGGEASAWNSVLRVNGLPFRIIGVAPPAFRGLVGGQAPKLYLPLNVYAELNPGWKSDNDWSVRWLNPFIRIPATTSRDAAEAELQPVYRAAAREELALQPIQSDDYLKELAHEHMSLVPAARGADAALSDWREPLRILQWMTLAVLLLAAINIAGLMLVRAVKQKHEMLIRYAVGATRAAVMRLHFIQTLALALAGGLLGLWIARWGARLLAHLAGFDARGALVYQPHGWTLALHWSIALVTGLSVGLLPAWQTARIDISAGLNEESLTHSATRSQAFVRRSLAAAQIALSMVLAIAAGLFAKSLHKLVSVPVGFDPGHLTVFSIDPKLAHSTVQSAELLWGNLQQRLAQLPEVTKVSYGTGGPFPQGADSAVIIPGTTAAAIAKHQNGLRSLIGPGYFRTFAIPLVAGREFDERDRANAPNVLIINQALAHRLFGAADPLGQTVTMFNGLDPNWLARVVGVVADSRQSWKRAAGSLIYTPALQAKSATEMTYYVRTRGAALSEQTIRRIVGQEAPGIAPSDIATMQSRMAEFAASERAMAVLVGAFAALALAIAAVGIYGVIAYGASLRTAEFGIRVSVGARPTDILRLVLREVVVILVAGFVLAAPLGYFGFALIRHQLGAISLSEPGIYAGAILLLTLCTLAAALIPARRATRLSVHGALRHG